MQDIALYHGTQVAGLTLLEPRMSNHGKAQVYLTEKWENVLPYLSNAVEKFCRKTGFDWNKPYWKWASYGFDTDGVLRLEEYWPHAARETYEGVAGWIYTVKRTDNMEKQLDVPGAWVSRSAVPVLEKEYVPDVWQAIENVIAQGRIRLRRYEEMSEKTRAWLERRIPAEWERAANHPEYRAFLEAKFPFVK